MIRASGRSWWQCRYSDGRVLSEWDTLISNLLHSQRTSRWEEIDKKGMIGLRILCPNGIAGELEAPEGYRFIQLKHGGIDIGIGGAGRRYVDAHIIGVITDTEGNCFCRAWEEKPANQYQLGIEAQLLTLNSLPNPTTRQRASMANYRQILSGREWQLIEFTDNIYHMAYRKIGPLSLEVQGVKL